MMLGKNTFVNRYLPLSRNYLDSDAYMWLVVARGNIVLWRKLDLLGKIPILIGYAFSV